MTGISAASPSSAATFARPHHAVSRRVAGRRRSGNRRSTGRKLAVCLAPHPWQEEQTAGTRHLISEVDKLVQQLSACNDDASDVDDACRTRASSIDDDESFSIELPPSGAHASLGNDADTLEGQRVSEPKHASEAKDAAAAAAAALLSRIGADIGTGPAKFWPVIANCMTILPPPGLELVVSGTASPTSSGTRRQSRVHFNLDAVSVHEITPYAEIYGVHPRHFVFDMDGRMSPSAFGGFVSLASIENCQEGDEEDDASGLHEDSGEFQ